MVAVALGLVKFMAFFLTQGFTLMAFDLRPYYARPQIGFV